MSIPVTCSCGKKLSARDDQVGKRAKCPQCGQTFVIAPNRAPGEEPAVPSGATPGPAYDGKPVAFWLDLLASSDAPERRKAADILAGVGPEAAGELDAFVRSCESEHLLARHWATVCLGAIGPAAKEALPALIARLGDDQPLVREKAAKAIEQVMPEARPLVPHLLRGLNEKDDDRRAAAVELFRRNLRTAGISRFRFWACTCGRVYIKVDLEQRLRQMADSPDAVSWEGKRSCGQCGAQFDDRDIYAGKYDVPETHWAKLMSKFGKQLSVPDDFLDETKQDAGYRISDESHGNEPFSTMPSLEPFSMSLAAPASMESDQGYAIAEAAPPIYGALGPRRQTDAEQKRVPGAVVRQSGKYKCTSCGKKRLSTASNTSAGPAPGRASVVMQFKAGKTFTECPQCGELTEWELLPPFSAGG
ncbi:MAG TPA: HEAT repeat domain-containing protein [Pirellulales bacterium]|nr:HEAT repeat domain-containing protein [Pirellulales bacterium]